MGATATFLIIDQLANKGKSTDWAQERIGHKTPQAASPTVSGPPITNDADNENQAQKSAERRRRMYAGIGRSSTILTGPGGLGSLGDSNQSPKMLLGV